MCSQRTCREVRRWLFSWSPEVDPHLYTEQQHDCEKRSTRCTWITHHLMRTEVGDMHRRVTSESSGSTWSAELSACGCSPEKGRQSPCGAERSNSAWPLLKSTVTSENVCFDLLVWHLSYAAARSTMEDISCRALSVRVVMASRSHSLMSVTTWSSKTHTIQSYNAE